jgi:23S rRNA pseudouridine1911/1915/1917 synthase
LSQTRILIVPGSAAGERLDSFLQRHAGEPWRSRSEWQRLLGIDAVRLNDKLAKPAQRVTEGDRVVVIEGSRVLDLPPEDVVPFEVVYEDPAMIVLNKPAGVVVHPAPGNERGTLVNGLLARYPELRDEQAELRPGIVHRLDKDTSGLMVVARSVVALSDLQQQMQQRTTEKRYLLLVRANIDEDEARIDRPIARDPRDRQRMSVQSGGRGSQTHFWVRERFGEWTLVEALLLTGRTHQLRVHFASIGHPVAGDAKYGTGRGPAGLKRQFVHACLLRLRSPFDQIERTFTTSLPPDLEQPLQLLRRRLAATR